MSQLHIFLPIWKVDAEQRLVYGTLTAEEPDKSGEIFDYASGKPAVQAWSDEIKAASGGKSLGNVRAMHDKVAAGKFTDIVYDDANKRIEGAAKIIDDDEWQKVVEGVYTGFSIGGSYTKRWQDPTNPSLWRFTPELSEISLVDNPCVPTATFEYIKADGTREMRKFHHSNNEDSMDPKLLKAAQDADAAGTATDEQKALLAKAATDAVKDGKPVKASVEPEQVWKASDGTTFATKNECRVYNVQLEKQASLAPSLSQVDALLKGGKKDEDEDEEKDDDTEEEKKAKKARREKKAADQAKKDDDMAEAAKAKKAEEDAEKAKKDKEEADKAAADALGKAAAAAAQKAAKAVVAAKAAPVEGLEKGLHQVGWLAHMLNEITCFQDSVEIEQYFEDDKDSELPAKLKSLVSEMCELLVTLVEEETSELTEGDDMDVEVLEMAAGLPVGHPDAIAKATRLKADPLVKSDSKVESAMGAKLIKFAEALEKAGARHSKADADRVQKLHDAAGDMHKCMGQMMDKCADMHKLAGESKNTAIDLGADGEPVDDESNEAQASGSGAAKMSKMLAEMQGLRAENTAMTKLAERMNTTLEKVSPFIETLQGTIREQESRLTHLEDQPLPAKGAARPVSKAQDNGGTGDGNAKAEFEAALEKMTPEQKAQALMKAALSNPMSKL